MDHLYFFGRFNFPHVGYLYVIREGLLQLKPTHGITIVFSVEQATWGKHAIALTHRQAMFSLAIQELPKELSQHVHFSSIEYELQKKRGDAYGGYTIDTLQELIQNNPGVSGIIMGADAMLGTHRGKDGFTAWKSWEEIQKTVTVITLPRGRFTSVQSIQTQLPPKVHPKILTAVPNPTERDASSTAIIQGNHAFLPTKVRAYALEHALLVQY